MVRPHGIRGEVAVEVRTDDPGQRFAAGSVLSTDPPAAGPLTVVSTRWHSGRLLVSFAGITDRNEAEPLRGVWLTVNAAQVTAPGTRMSSTTTNWSGSPSSPPPGSGSASSPTCATTARICW